MMVNLEERLATPVETRSVVPATLSVDNAQLWTIDAVELAQQLGKVAAGLLRSRPRDMMVVAVEPTGRGWNLMIADRSFPDQPVGINLVTVLDNLADGRVPAGLRFRPRRNRWFRRGRS